eukprot:TRINITY_DN4515_c0_g1_i1.p2 TRINITY_DN4515_c0_g1~~TRINITY_DN4515_c0_g1_i1.p2  ORF type:complete len:125 (+),score=17.56 TRINITY_DN4515_c0_g1_i1:469-843(+)
MRRRLLNEKGIEKPTLTTIMNELVLATMREIYKVRNKVHDQLSHRKKIAKQYLQFKLVLKEIKKEAKRREKEVKKNEKYKTKIKSRMNKVMKELKEKLEDADNLPLIKKNKGDKKRNRGKIKGR